MTGFELSIPNMDDAIRKIGSLAGKFDQAAQASVGMVGLAVERKAKQLLNNNQHAIVNTKNGKRRWMPSGHMGGDGTPPNRRTGNLIRSIYTELKHEPGSYVANVFPSALYGKALELGNPNWKSGVKYPYMKPALDYVRPQATRIFETNFAKRMAG